MTAPECGGWATLADLPATKPDRSTQEWCRLLELATDVLWAATGRRWRGYESSESAVLEVDCPRPGWLRPVDHYWGGWTPVRWDRAEPRRARLPRPDVTDVTAVTRSGEPYPGWRREGNWLVRTTGVWPLDGTVEVTYSFGRLAPAGAVAACVALALHYAGGVGSGERKPVPARATSLTRQAISYDLVGPDDLLTKGLTGVTEVDQWITAMNPAGVRQEAQVWSPDLTVARRTG